MHTVKETNDLFEQIDQELIDQDYSGIHCVINDLIPDYAIKTGEEIAIDWFGFSDLTL